MKKAVSGIILALLLMCPFTLLLKVQPSRAELTTDQSLLPAYSEIHLPVPFYYQEKDYYCGPAALQMVFNYYGENISQSEIACVARSIGDPLYVTYTDELRRAGQFSNISTSMGDELPSNITGYTLRQLGYAAFEAQGIDLTTLRDFLDQGKPLILLMWYSSHHVSTHYRVATGYNETHVFLHDPWNQPLWGGTYGGPNIAFNNSQFLDLWSYYDNWTLYVSPWTVNMSAPAYLTPGTPFQMEFTITYPQPLPNALFAYPASSCIASITLPANLSLDQGESQEKTLGTGFLQAGNSSSLSWTLIAGSSVAGTVSVTVEGMISGSVGASQNYAAYIYSDRIGATVNFTVNTASGHDIAVTNVLPSKAVVGQGCSLNVSVTVANQGSYTENFNMTVFANAATIQTEEIALASGVSATITLILNTSSLVYGNYAITAYATPVPNETNIVNNNYTCDIPVHVGVPGDVSGTVPGVYDGIVNMKDIAYIVTLLNTEANSPNWNPNADINNDGIVNMSDVAIAITNFNKHENQAQTKLSADQYFIVSSAHANEGKFPTYSNGTIRDNTTVLLTLLDLNVTAVGGDAHHVYVRCPSQAFPVDDTVASLPNGTSAHDGAWPIQLVGGDSDFHGLFLDLNDNGMFEVEVRIACDEATLATIPVFINPKDIVNSALAP
ncbi:MAG: C39 family peptidase [Candidatus Bathyarchaeia archaeon]